MKMFKIMGWSLFFFSLIFFVPVNNYMGLAASRESASNTRLEIFLFGDSNYFYPPTKQENDYYSLQVGGFLQSYLPNAHISQWVQKAARMRDYLCAFKYLVVSQERPGLLIIPINWRSFSENWLNRSKRHYRQDPITDAEIYRYNPLTIQFNRVQDMAMLHLYLFKQSALARMNMKYEKPAHPSPEILKTCYPMTIEKENETMKDLESFMLLAKENDFPVLFVFMPLKKHPAYYCEDEFRKTKAGIKQMITAQGLEYLDLSEFLSAGEFYDDAGHMLIDARSRLAYEIAQNIRR